MISVLQRVREAQVDVAGSTVGAMVRREAFYRLMNLLGGFSLGTSDYSSAQNQAGGAQNLFEIHNFFLNVSVRRTAHFVRRAGEPIVGPISFRIRLPMPPFA